MTPEKYLKKKKNSLDYFIQAQENKLKHDKVKDETSTLNSKNSQEDSFQNKPKQKKTNQHNQELTKYKLNRKKILENRKLEIKKRQEEILNQIHRQEEQVKNKNDYFGKLIDLSQEYIHKYQKWKLIQDNLNRANMHSKKELMVRNTQFLNDIQKTKERIADLSHKIKIEKDLILEPQYYNIVLEIYEKSKDEDLVKALKSQKRKAIDEIIKKELKSIIDKYKIILKELKNTKDEQKFACTLPKWRI